MEAEDEVADVKRQQREAELLQGTYPVDYLLEEDGHAAILEIAVLV